MCLAIFCIPDKLRVQSNKIFKYRLFHGSFAQNDTLCEIIKYDIAWITVTTILYAKQKEENHVLVKNWGNNAIMVVRCHFLARDTTLIIIQVSSIYTDYYPGIGPS